MNKARRQERRRQRETEQRRNPDPLWEMEAERVNDRLQYDATTEMAMKIMGLIEQFIPPECQMETLERIGCVCINGLESYRKQLELIQRRLNPAQM
jgi:hypothetical protein